MAILTEEQYSLRKVLRDFAKKEIAPHAAEYDRTEQFPWQNIEKMAGLGIMGLPVPEQYGGAQADMLSYMIAVEEISKACAATGAILTVHTSLGTMPVLLFGTEEQKQRYIPDLASGRRLGAFALTEPSAGSDMASIACSAESKGDSYVINGTKCFIINGGVADIYTVFAKTRKDAGAKGISAFIVEKDTPGFTAGRRDGKMGIRGACTAELIFENCVIPRANLLGAEGEGFAIAARVLDGSRIGIAAQSVGISQAAYEEALHYASMREQFNMPVSSFQGVSFMLADMAIQIEAARLMVHHAAQRQDAGLPYGTEASMAKTFASDTAVKVTVDAVQIMGGYAYLRDYPVERLMRDAKITQIYEGTNQIQRMLIAGNILEVAAHDMAIHVHGHYGARTTKCTFADN